MLHELADRAKRLERANLQERGHASLAEELWAFLSKYEPLGIPAEPQHIWHRARQVIGKEYYANLGEMLYPPQGSPDYGRAQLPGSRVLYAGWNLNTALDELGTNPGDIVQTIAIRVLPSRKVICLPIGEWQSFYNQGRSFLGAPALEREMAGRMTNDPMGYLCNAYMDSVVSSIFRRPVTRSYEYKLSAIFSERLHLAGGAIVYPSVKNANGRNIAISATGFDGNFEILYTNVLRIKRVHGHGFYDVEATRVASEFGPDGEIDWSSQKHCPTTWSVQGGVAVAPDYRGWVRK